MKEQLVRFLETRNTTLPTKHGFRKYLSTVTAVSSLVEKTIAAFKDESFALIMCDLRKAFDIISHYIVFGGSKL